MDEPTGYELILRNAGVNFSDFVKPGDDSTQRNWFHRLREPSSYYEFLTENSSLVQKAPTHVFDSISASGPVNDPCFAQAMSELVCNNNTGVSSSSSSSSRQAVPSPEFQAWKFTPYPFMLNSEYHKALLNLRCSEQYDEMDRFIQFNASQNQTQTQSHSSLTQEPSGSTSNVSRSSHRKRKASLSVNVTRQMASSTDRKRRERIAERVKALHDLLPNPEEGSQMAMMDEIIGYVKHLQQQMKELSKAKLGGEFRSCPNIFNEGNQHYDQTMKEPMEVTFAKLLKVDTSAAIKFLESKGLFVRPLPMADRLQ